MTHIAVIDYGMGNLHSVAKALEHVSVRSGLQAKVSVTADPMILRDADRLVFPGVGAMRDCMAEIRHLCIDEILREQVREKPVLAICVGMQALMQHSEENNGVDCIGLFAGNVRRFPEHQKDANGNVLKVPHRMDRGNPTVPLFQQANGDRQNSCAQNRNSRCRECAATWDVA